MSNPPYGYQPNQPYPPQGGYGQPQQPYGQPAYGQPAPAYGGGQFPVAGASQAQPGQHGGQPLQPQGGPEFTAVAADGLFQPGDEQRFPYGLPPEVVAERLAQAAPVAPVSQPSAPAPYEQPTSQPSAPVYGEPVSQPSAAMRGSQPSAPAPYDQPLSQPSAPAYGEPSAPAPYGQPMSQPSASAYGEPVSQPSAPAAADPYAAAAYGPADALAAPAQDAFAPSAPADESPETQPADEPGLLEHTPFAPEASAPFGTPQPYPTYSSEPTPVPQPAAVGETNLQPRPDDRPADQGWMIELDDGREIEIHGLALLGRNPQPRPGEHAQIVTVGDETRKISKTHFAVGVDERGIYLCDRGSTNGTAIENAPDDFRPCPEGEMVRLVEGQKISFGDHSLLIRRR